MLPTLKLFKIRMDLEMSGETSELAKATAEAVPPAETEPQPYDELDQALARANDTRYGLQASIFTADLAGALAAARTLDFGGVLVNEVPTFRTDQMPYGGIRESGNTTEGPHWAVREMTRERLVVIQR